MAAFRFGKVAAEVAQSRGAYAERLRVSASRLESHEDVETP